MKPRTANLLNCYLYRPLKQTRNKLLLAILTQKWPSSTKEEHPSATRPSSRSEDPRLSAPSSRRVRLYREYGFISRLSSTTSQNISGKQLSTILSASFTDSSTWCKRKFQSKFQYVKKINTILKMLKKLTFNEYLVEPSNITRTKALGACSKVLVCIILIQCKLSLIQCPLS